MICIPVKKISPDSFEKKLKTAQKLADIIEIWFDELERFHDKELKKIFDLKKRPYIYKSTKLNNLEKILKYPLEYVDFDVNTPIKIIQKVKKISPKTKIILSFHDYGKTPPKIELLKIIDKMLEKNAEIVKIACYANTFLDSLSMMEILSELYYKDQKAICVCMGEEGKITRTAGHLLGNYLMYAPIKISEKTAKGQIKAEELGKIQNLLK
ncbi:type I 3-dehydroquinate dehydratase [Candidatus Peregrinibacteria bacterium]|nr:type I 3-dehydroquinate dehydratase [Candidatus Peregrinibacteria bacterium]